jgi:D-3-phosphoglycerate dehydrogenase
VRGKTLGIVGYGHVGSQLGVMAESLSLRVLFYDILAIMPIGRAEPRASLQELLAESDYVALNISSTTENDFIFGKKELGWMKPGSYLINVSYGNAVDQDALAEAIRSGQLAGAAMDVFPQGPKKGSFTCPLQGLPNVLLTPGIAGDTKEARLRIVQEVTSHIVRYIRDGTTTGAVNFPNIAGWPLKQDNRRIICMHRNVRGVLKEIDHILSAYNVGKQVLDTKDDVGYLVADVATSQVTTEIVAQLAILANCIRTRII